MDKNKLYQSLYSAYVEAYFPNKSKKVCQEQITKKWNEIKNDEDFKNKSDCLMRELKSISLKKKSAALTFWSKQSSKQVSPEKNDVQLEFTPGSSQFHEPEELFVEAVGHVNAGENSEASRNTSTTERKYVARAQIELQFELDLINSDLVCLYEREKRTVE